MTEKTKVIPTTAIYSAFPEKIPIQAPNPPSESEPVSPIKILAGEELNKRYAVNAPQREKARIACPKSCPNEHKTPSVAKNGRQEFAAKPSNPSVKLTPLTVAKKTKMLMGIIHIPTSILHLTKGIFNVVKPARKQKIPAKTATSV